MTPLVLFVPSSTISSHLSNSVRGVDLSWEEWGPTGTRMRIAPSGHSAVWVCYVWGLKFVAPYRFGTNVFEHPRGPKMIQMFDFNQLSIRRAIANGETKEELEDGTSAIFTDATELKVPGVFQETIRTSLPFRWWSKKVPYHQRGAYESVMINEDAIVTVNSVSSRKFSSILYSTLRRNRISENIGSCLSEVSGHGVYLANFLCQASIYTDDYRVYPCPQRIRALERQDTVMRSCSKDLWFQSKMQMPFLEGGQTYITDKHDCVFGHHHSPKGVCGVRRYLLAP